MGQTKEQRILKQLSNPASTQKRTAIATDMFLPNHSGDHSAGIVNTTPTTDTDIANKKYVDDEIAGIPAPIVYLLRDGSNANSDIDIGSYDLTTTGTISTGQVLNIGLNDATDPTINFLGSTNDGSIVYDESQGAFKVNGRLEVRGNADDDGFEYYQGGHNYGAIFRGFDTAIATYLEIVTPATGGSQFLTNGGCFFRNNDKDEDDSLMRFKNDHGSMLFDVNTAGELISFKLASNTLNEYVRFIDSSSNELFVVYGDGNARIGNDNKRLSFGATATDLQIYSDGTDGNIDTTGDLEVGCGTDKTIELQETVYRDINMAGYLLTRPTSNQPDIVSFLDEDGTDTTIETYGFDTGEKVHGGFELQHDYAEGTDLVFHVHWQGITAPTGTDNVQWRLNYILMRDGETLNAAVVIDSPDTVFDTQYETVRSDFTAITGTNFKIGDQFMFTLERVTATGDAYAGDALIATAGIHYQVNTIGSRQILVK